MKQKMRIWDTKSNAFYSESEQTEIFHKIEKLVSENTLILGRNYLVVMNHKEDEQDTCCKFILVDISGSLTGVLFQKNSSNQDIISLALNCASDIKELKADDIHQLFEKSNHENFEKAFIRKFNNLPDDLNKNQNILIISNSLELTKEKTFVYLTDTFNIPINVVALRYFSHSDHEIIQQDWYNNPTDEETDVEKKVEEKSNKLFAENHIQPEHVQEDFSGIDDITSSLEDLLKRLQNTGTGSAKSPDNQGATSMKSDFQDRSLSGNANNQTNAPESFPSLEEILTSFLIDSSNQKEETKSVFESEPTIQELVREHFTPHISTDRKVEPSDTERKETLASEKNIPFHETTDATAGKTDSLIVEQSDKHIENLSTENKLDTMLKEREKNLIGIDNMTSSPTWDNAYLLGIEELDNHHKVLFHIYDGFVQAYKSDNSLDDIKALLDKLNAFKNYHFEAEEKIMKDFNYDNISRHLKEHELFGKTIYEFSKLYKYGNKVLVNEIIIFLKKWFISHISGTDIEFRNFLVQKGHNLQQVSSFVRN